MNEVKSGRIKPPELHEARILGEGKLEKVRLTEKAGKITGWTIKEKRDNRMEKTWDWISVKDRLPQDDEYVLVTCKKKNGQLNVIRAYYYDGEWRGNVMSEVIAWMPMPGPYKEHGASEKKTD